MLNYLWPILLVISANCLYNICTKSTPAEVNSFASLCITYVVAAVITAIMYFVTSPQKNVFQEISKSNWSSIALGISIVALEIGSINMYRVGWKISVGSLVANIGLACVLLFVGLLIYKETISLRQLLGMGICVMGLILINK